MLQVLRFARATRFTTENPPDCAGLIRPYFFFRKKLTSEEAHNGNTRAYTDYQSGAEMASRK
jgi:hypothetical protein